MIVFVNNNNIKFVKIQQKSVFNTSQKDTNDTMEIVHRVICISISTHAQDSQTHFKRFSVEET